MARPSTGANFNIVQLEQILEGRRVELQRLGRQRSELERKLNALDRQISKLQGGPGANGRRGRGGAGTRARNEKPLPDVMEAVMRAAGEPMRVGAIVEGVEAAGYRSSSDNFKGIVNQQLIKDKRFAQVERGVYQLKK